MLEIKSPHLTWVGTTYDDTVEIITFSFALLLQYSWVLKFPATFRTLFSIGPIVFSELDDSASCFGQSSMKQTIE